MYRICRSVICISITVITPSLCKSTDDTPQLRRDGAPVDVDRRFVLRSTINGLALLGDSVSAAGTQRHMVTRLYVPEMLSYVDVSLTHTAHVLLA